MSATWPRPCPCSGRSRIEPAAPSSTTARCGSPAVVERLAVAWPGRGAGRARGDARPSRRERPLRLAQARHRRAPHRHLGAARQGRAGRGVRARRRCGRGGLARHRPALSPHLRLGGGQRRRSRPPRMCRSSARSCSPIRSRSAQVSLDDYAAEWKWDGIRVQLVHAGGETRLYSRAGDDITGSFPDVAEAFASDGRARRRIAGEGRGPGRREAQAAARRASTRSSRGSAARPSRAKMLGDYPAFVRLYDILFDGKEDLRALPLTERRAAARGLRRPGSIRDRFDVSALIEADGFRGAGGDPRRRPRRRDRGRDAEAPRQPLCRRPPRRPLVQMEARPARRRLRADVRRSAAAASAPPIIRITPSAAGPRTAANCCRSARPISASPTRS